MNEIRFRHSEEQVEDEVRRRENCFRMHIAATDHPCTTCGSHAGAIADARTFTVECRNCFARRRFLELVGESWAP